MDNADAQSRQVHGQNGAEGCHAEEKEEKDEYIADVAAFELFDHEPLPFLISRRNGRYSAEPLFSVGVFSC